MRSSATVPTAGRRAPRRRSGVLAAILTCIVACWICATAPVEAHVIGLSKGTYTARQWGLAVELVFAREEIASLVPSLDADRDGHLSAREISVARKTFEDVLLSRVVVRAAGVPCPALVDDVALTEQDGVYVRGRCVCREVGSLQVDVGFLSVIARGHRHVARVMSADEAHEEVLYREHSEFEVRRTGLGERTPEPPLSEGAGTGPEVHSAVGGAAPVATNRAVRGWSFVRMGITHIATGYDHLLFLLALVLTPGRTRSLVGTITAFTCAHSLTLALAVLGNFTPSGRVVEPAIALTIAYVGVENLLTKTTAPNRWRVCFGFGLLHGFGFASGLRDLAIPRADVALALVSFNVGVEIAQLAALALLLPLVGAVAARPWFRCEATRVLSGVVAAAGGIWFVTRIVRG